MFYVNPKGKYQKRFLESTDNNKEKVQLTIQYILQIPASQRSEKDHQQIFYYFKNHQFFCEIQRVKSLRARILCTSMIQLIPSPSSTAMLKQQQQFIVLQQFKKSNQMAVILQVQKNKILSSDQTFIKQRMIKLKQYSLIKRLGYNEALYLACFLQQQTPKYKEYLYKQNQQVCFNLSQKQNSSFIFLIESGEYQILKNVQSIDESLQNSRLRKKTSKSKLDQYVEFQQSPYKYKNKRVKYEEVYNVEGGYGQSIGQIQFFLQKSSRIYSVRCKSSHNKVFKCHLKHFMMIFESNQNLFHKIKREFEQRQKFQQKSIVLRNSLRSPKSKDTFNLGQYVTEIQNNSLNLKSLNHSHHHNHKISQKKYLTLQIEHQNSPKNRRYIHNQLQQNPQKQTFTLEDNLLPKIDKNKNNSSLKRKQKRFPGLIDSSFLIKQKQDVLNRKYQAKNVLNKEVFSFNPNKNIRKVQTNSSKNTNENRNLAHSKNFMKKLLIDALKKSGYLNEDQITQKICFNNDLLKQKLKYRVQAMGTSAHQHTYELILQLEKKAQEQLEQRINNQEKLLNRKERRSLASNNFDKFFFKL